MTDHPMQPTPEQVQQWLFQPNSGVERIRTAYAAGADAQLEACCTHMAGAGQQGLATYMRHAMRPKPPSLAEQALAVLDDSRLDAAHENCIRRALERLAELEGQQDG